MNLNVKTDSCLQKALFMALRFSGRWSSTCVTDSAGWLMHRVVYGGVGPPEDDMARTAAWPGSHKPLSERAETHVNIQRLQEEMQEINCKNRRRTNSNGRQTTNCVLMWESINQYSHFFTKSWGLIDCLWVF